MLDVGLSINSKKILKKCWFVCSQKAPNSNPTCSISFIYTLHYIICVSTLTHLLFFGCSSLHVSGLPVFLNQICLNSVQQSQASPVSSESNNSRDWWAAEQQVVFSFLQLPPSPRCLSAAAETQTKSELERERSDRAGSRIDEWVVSS